MGTPCREFSGNWPTASRPAATSLSEKPIRPDDLFALIEQQAPAEATHTA